MAKPIVAISFDVARFDGYNLALVRYDAQRGDWQRHGGRNDGYRRYKSGEREVGSAEVKAAKWVWRIDRRNCV